MTLFLSDTAQAATLYSAQQLITKPTPVDHAA
jgi:hypothetical protein